MGYGTQPSSFLSSLSYCIMCKLESKQQIQHRWILWKLDCTNFKFLIQINMMCGCIKLKLCKKHPCTARSKTGWSSDLPTLTTDCHPWTLCYIGYIVWWDPHCYLCALKLYVLWNFHTQANVPRITVCTINLIPDVRDDKTLQTPSNCNQ